MMPLARFSFTLRAVFWRDADKWHGAGLELDAESDGPTLHAAVGALMGHAHKLAMAALEGGEFPGRPLADVDDSVRGRWERLLEAQNGQSMPLSKLFACEDGFEEVAVELDVSPQIEMKTPPALKELKVVLFKNDGWWIAQCLDVDIGAEGRTQESAMVAFEDVALGQLLVDAALGRQPFEGLEPAPDKFSELYKQSTEVRAESSARLPSSYRVASAA